MTSRQPAGPLSEERRFLSERGLRRRSSSSNGTRASQYGRPRLGAGPKARSPTPLFSNQASSDAENGPLGVGNS